jgi:hypothetical protein
MPGEADKGANLERLVRKYGHGMRQLKQQRKHSDRSKYDGKGQVKRKLYGEDR